MILRPIDNLIIKEAHNWIGTPYRHQGSRKHVGCDCLGLVRGIWAEVYGVEPEEPKPYAKDWAEQISNEPMLEAARKYCGREICQNNSHDGCLVLFRWHKSSAIKHAGILTAENKFIHAYERMAVTESALVPSWRKRIAAIFEFPTL